MPYAITATAEPAAGRVRLEAQGGPPGGVLYMFRRDDAGVGVVRDTSEGTVVWPAYGAVLRTQLVKNSNSSTTPMSTSGYGTTGAGTQVRTAGVGENGSYAAVQTWTVAATGGTVQSRFGGASGADDINVVAGTTITGSIAVKASHARSGAQGIRVQVDFYTAANVFVSGSLVGTLTAFTAGQQQRLSVTGVVPATATRAVITSGLNDATGIPIGFVLTTSRPFVSTAGGTYFDAATPDTVALHYAATGAVNASTTTESSYSLVTVYDYEAVQGELTDYLLADVDGVQTAVTSLTVPLWGTWLKSPGRPFLNTLCHFVSEGEVVRAARRLVVDIEGTKRPIVLSEARGDKGGVLQLAVRDEESVDGMDRLFDDGMTLMLDVPPSWGVPFRYISVGPVTRARPLSDGTLNLQSMARLFTLGDVVAVDAPIGVTVVDAGQTYATLPTLYGSYAAMAATNPTYLVLALGS